jgi:hypothetical protein
MRTLETDSRYDIHFPAMTSIFPPFLFLASDRLFRNISQLSTMAEVFQFFQESQHH